MINQYDIYVAAALSGISGHAVGPIKRPDETTVEAHARWAHQVAMESLLIRKKNKEYIDTLLAEPKSDYQNLTHI